MSEPTDAPLAGRTDARPDHPRWQSAFGQPPAPPSGADATPAPWSPCPECGTARVPFASSAKAGTLAVVCPTCERVTHEPSAPAALPPIPVDIDAARHAFTEAMEGRASLAEWAHEYGAALLALPGDARPEGDALRWCVDRVYRAAKGEISPDEMADPSAVAVAERAYAALRVATPLPGDAHA